MECWLPYSKTEVPVRIADENLMGIIESKPKKILISSPQEEIARALDNPIGSLKIENLVKHGEKVCIVVDDKTRSTPSQLMIQPILTRLNDADVKDSDITVLFGCGMHSTMRLDEAALLIGEDAAKRV